ncbi:unnamed protein product [Cladocopium goreaui]|uniref:Uncharacterized protein n=1 Tax=Cladocopium goreaui TaxID=2562237 RepID=A0A9P1DTM8_9DINO|nr:unnamed protein product [Cladocopium goreaui]
MAQFEAYTETFETLDLTAQSNSNAANWVQFSYGVEDGTYGYLVKETGGILLRFSLATFSNVEEFSVSLTGTTARALMVGDYIHIFYSQQGFGQWAQWYLGDNGTTVVDFTMDSSYESRDAVFTGDGIYLLVGVVMMPQWGMKKICQERLVGLTRLVFGTSESPRNTAAESSRFVSADKRSRTFTLQQCSRQVTEYMVSQELTGATGSSFSDDVHLYHLSSTRLLYRINLHPTVTENVLEFSSLTYGNGLTDYTFDGGFHDGNYGYLVPGIGDNFVFRFILETFNGGTFLDLSEIGQSGNCKDGFASGSYGFLLPAQDGTAAQLSSRIWISVYRTDEVDEAGE